MIKLFYLNRLSTFIVPACRQFVVFQIQLSVEL